MIKRLLGIFGITSAALVIACGGGDSKGDANPSPTATGTVTPATSPTALEVALRDINDDGTWSAETALRAFAAAFGPLPGVTTPQGSDGWQPGTLAVRMVEARWDQLSQQQQDAILDYLGPGGSVITVGYSARLAAARADYQAIANQSAADVGALLGRPLGIPVRVSVSDEERLDKAWAWTEGNWDEVGAASLPTACDITLFSQATDPQNAAYARFVITHEVFHCFQDSLSDKQLRLDVPPWVAEGSATWVAEVITNGQGVPPTGFWGQYVHDPGRPLFARSYDAVGFFAQMDYAGIDPWKVLDKMWLARFSDPALQTSGATSMGFQEQWGSSWFRDGRPSGHWAMTANFGIPPVNDRASPQDIQISDGAQGAVSASPNSGGIASVHSSAFVTRAQTSGLGRVGDEGGSYDRVLHSESLDLCTSASGDCKCPEGSPNNPAEPMRSPQTFRAAVTGEPHNLSELLLTGISRDEWCGKKTPTPTPATTSTSATADCSPLLPANEVQEATGIDIGEPTPIELTAFDLACGWIDVLWTLQAKAKANPEVNPNHFAGVSCAASGATTDIAYCLNAAGNGAGGNIITRHWSYVFTAPGISLRQLVDEIIPILARHG